MNPRYRARPLAVALALALASAAVGCARADPAGPATTDNHLGLLISEGGDAGTLWLWDVGSGELRRLAPDHAVHACCFSPDGGRIAFTGERRARGGEFRGLELWVLDLASETVRQVTAGLWAGERNEIAWRPGTEQVAVARAQRRDPEASLPDDGGLWLVDVQTGAMTSLIGPANADWPMCRHPRFSADGTMLATTRQGRYAAVLVVDQPERWLRLDSPRHMNPEFLMDWAWRPDSQTLLLAATTAERRIGGPDGAQVRGPGGVWEWPLSEQWATTSPQLNGQEPSAQDDTAARPLFAQGTTVFAVAISNDGARLAYVTPEGVWQRELESGSQRRLLALDMEEASELDAEWGAGLTLALLQWSPDDRYIWASPGDGASCVIDVAGGEVIPVPQAGREGAWRPEG